MVASWPGADPMKDKLIARIRAFQKSGEQQRQAKKQKADNWQSADPSEQVKQLEQQHLDTLKKKAIDNSVPTPTPSASSGG